MLRDITLGQYYPSDSVIHKMDPRVKLFGTIVFIISLFLFQTISVYVVATLFLAAVIMISKVPFSFMVKGLKGIFVLMMITVVFNLFLTPGTTAFAIWKLKVTWEGIRQAAFMAVRPILLDETDKIMKAQMARCADFESGGLIKKAKSLVPLLVPLFISAFRRANDLAMAMEARGYRGGEGRTKMKPLIYKKRDHVAYVILLTYLVCIIATGNIIAF